MWTRQVIITALLSVSVPGYSQQTDCGKILEAGIFDQTLLSTSESSRQTFSAWQCSTEFKTHDEAISAGVSIGVPIYGVPLKVDGSFSNQQRDTWKKAHCAASAGSADYAKRYLELKNLVAPAVVEAWSRCVEVVNQFRPGLKCSVASNDNENVIFTIKYTPLDDADTKRPIVKSSSLSGATLVQSPAKQELLPSKTVISSSISVPLKRLGKSPVMLVVNTSRGACDAYVPGVSTSFEVGASIRPTAEQTTPTSQTFHFENGTGDDCGRNFGGEEHYCLATGEVRDWVGPYISSSNCPTNASYPGVPRKDPANAACVFVPWHIEGCGTGFFGDCKGRGWLGFDITVRGDQWSRVDLPSFEWPNKNQGNQLVFNFKYPYGIPPGNRNPAWHYTVDVRRRHGIDELAVQLSDGNPAALGIVTSISADGQLVIDATAMVSPKD